MSNRNHTDERTDAHGDSEDRQNTPNSMALECLECFPENGVQIHCEDDDGVAEVFRFSNMRTIPHSTIPGKS